MRGTIVVDTPEQALAARRAAEAQFKVKPEGIRDFITGEPGPDGYRDIKLNVMFDGGLIGEVQINLRPMLTAKAEAHALYERMQEIERAAMGRSATPEELAAMDDLTSRQREIYEAAFARSRTERTSDQNASVDTGVPLREADAGSNSRGGSVSQATLDVMDRGSEGRNSKGTSDTATPQDTGISPSISKNLGMGKPLEGPSAQDRGNIRATLSPELQEAMRLADEATAAVRAEIDAGRLAPEAAAELAAADQALETAMGNARAYEAAAACLVVGMGAAAP